VCRCPIFALSADIRVQLKADCERADVLSVLASLILITPFIQGLATSCTVRGSNLGGGEIFITRPD
jgi:hypothetical protein